MADIMIVDDEPTIQQLMAIILDDMGHTVVEQSLNGEIALRSYEALTRKPDLLIIDHRMPVMSGKDLAAMVLKDNPGQRILFLSADESVKEAVSSLGITQFLEKPADIKTIKAAIEASLG